MTLDGKRIGILLTGSPLAPGFRHGVRLARAALSRGVAVYLYCIDEAVAGVDDVELQALKMNGHKLFACAYAARQRDLPLNDLATFSGLGGLSDLVTGTDRFVAFS